MNAGLRVTAELEIPARELQWRFSRSSGPGGQGVNTTDSRVELSWNPHTSEALAELPAAVRNRVLDRLSDRLAGGMLTVVASEHRSQLRNRDAASARLCAILRSALQPPPRARRPTKATAGSVRRRLEAKKHRAQIKKKRQAREE